VTLAEDVLLHLRVPALGLMAEVHSGLEQLLHRQRGHASSFGLPPPRSAGARRPPPKARGVWNGELRRVLGIEPYVLLAEIAGPRSVLAPAQAEVDRDLIFRRSHDLPNALQTHAFLLHPPLDQALLAEGDGDLARIDPGRRLAEGHHDPAPVG